MTRRPLFESNPRETVEESRSRARLDAVGFVVCRLSQARATNQTEGVSDTYAVHPGIGVAVWLESKRRKGSTTSRTQEQFAAVHDAAHLARVAREEGFLETPVGLGVPATILGTTDDVDRFLIRVGLAFRTSGGEVMLRPMKTAAYHEWHRVQREERERRKLAARIRRTTRNARR